MKKFCKNKIKKTKKINKKQIGKGLCSSKSMGALHPSTQNSDNLYKLDTQEVIKQPLIQEIITRITSTFFIIYM